MRTVREEETWNMAREEGRGGEQRVCKRAREIKWGDEWRMVREWSLRVLLLLLVRCRCSSRHERRVLACIE